MTSFIRGKILVAQNEKRKKNTLFFVFEKYPWQILMHVFTCAIYFHDSHYTVASWKNAHEQTVQEDKEDHQNSTVSVIEYTMIKM